MTSSTVLHAAQQHLPEVIALRRRLHQVPEIGLHLPQTQQLILEALEGLGLEITVGEQLSSVVAVLRGRGTGPVVLLRGDMDALPVHEDNDLDYASTIDGAMHACGHDLHSAGLVGAARILAERREELDGDVIFMFQPAEEGPGGALPMIEEGLMEIAGRPIAAGYSVHVHSHGLPFGVFRGKVNAINANCDEFSVRVIGEGGHASAPSRCKDPLPAACEMVLALQTQITRAVDVFDPVVLTVGRFVGGAKDNVIPDAVEFGGTIRSFSAPSRALMQTMVPRVIESIAAAHDLEVEIEYVQGYPACVNDPVEYDVARGVVEDLFGDDSFLPITAPVGSGDDFAYVMEKVPSVYFGIGATVGDPATSAPGHSPRAVFDDSILLHTTAFLAELALRRTRAADTAGGAA